MNQVLKNEDEAVTKWWIGQRNRAGLGSVQQQHEQSWWLEGLWWGFKLPCPSHKDGIIYWRAQGSLVLELLVRMASFWEAEEVFLWLTRGGTRGSWHLSTTISAVSGSNRPALRGKASKILFHIMEMWIVAAILLAIIHNSFHGLTELKMDEEGVPAKMNDSKECESNPVQIKREMMWSREFQISPR